MDADPHTPADALFLLTSWQYYVSWNDVMAAM